ncbi:polyprenyl synthetase family protein [Flavobacterium sp. NRK F10]|uniref:polyprenyl synthetase family protein n=1 Tax=Flavobacterium sp. NRK F10 TaxID=2954931 RepID=UPI002090E8CF|nr:polyprenyl synthetase family protein [Flavobacterium sp. NRK F10]MCO6174919.1 polyprenyl synthetase family protein [Flavobacterium sp. NRK F10]
MQTITDYQNSIAEHFNSLDVQKEPANLYSPIQYILNIGGKRIRPMLTVMVADIFNCAIEKALPAATAVEVFHNFSLIHDDIMDEAPLRRGHQTVHEKWDLNTGILSGDAMLILAYQFFENYEPKIFRQLAKLFSKTALEVCEGQQYDVDFEIREDVTVPEYLKMIEYKTAVLVGAAMKMGAIVAEANEEDANLVYDFGLNLGIAFQLQDDYLDAFGDPETFGKQVGGDIIENKKTYLYLMAMQNAEEDIQRQLQYLFSLKPNDSSEKVELVKNIFRNSRADEMTKLAIREYTDKAMKTLEAIQVAEDKKQVLRAFGENLMNRNV